MNKLLNQIKNLYLKIIYAINKFISDFRNASIINKLNYVVMGIAPIKDKQYHRGIFYLLVQVLYLAYMLTFGFSYIFSLSHLGRNVQEEIYNEDLGIFETIKGDNSMLILLYGVSAIIISIVVFWIYILNLKTAKENTIRIKEGKRPKTIKEEFDEYRDDKFHITITLIPIITITLFIIIPLVFMVLIAFTNYDKNHQPPGNLFTWVGLSNFFDLFGRSKQLGTTFFGLLGWTIIWAITATFLNYILGMILALIINKDGIKYKSFWRTIFVVTIAVPQFVSLLLMSKLLDNVGTVNQILELFKMTPIKFLTNGNNARITVILVNLWIGIPYTMLSTMGILMNIPKDLYEAARIDGANLFQQFVKITWPYMSYVMTPYLITTFIGNINNFNVIYLLTGGGPAELSYMQAGKTDLLITWLYKLTTSTDFNYGLASTIGIIIFIITASFSLITFNNSKSVKSEDEFR